MGKRAKRKRGQKSVRGLGRDKAAPPPPFFPQAPARVFFSRSLSVRADPPPTLLSESLEQASVLRVLKGQCVNRTEYLPFGLDNTWNVLLGSIVKT